MINRGIRFGLCGALALGLLVPAPAGAAETGKKVKIFLLGGQSNMVGLGQVHELKPPYNAPFPAVKIWQGKWVPLAPGMGNGRQCFGPEIAFGHALAAAYPDEDIRLIKYAAGGTALYNDWAPTNGPQYIAFMKTARAALGELDAGHVKYELGAFLWLQGESDASEQQGALYEKNLKAFIAHMRTQFRSPRLPFIIARVRDFYGHGPQAKLVREAQYNLAKTLENVVCFDTDDCGALIQGGHYNTAGLIEIGKRFAGGYQQPKSK